MEDCRANRQFRRVLISTVGAAMKLCYTCGQALAESVKTCPNCGSEVTEGLTSVDNYRILEVVHEGHASVLYRAIEEEAETPVALRLFTANSGVDEAVAQRLADELEELQKLPAEWFVQHHAIKCSSDGKWYRISEWIEAESWGSLLSSGRLQDTAIAYDLFYRLAAILTGLHQSGHFIPHLILNDILVLKGEPGRVDVKIDYKLSRFLDPNMAQPGPMLQHLLDCHPDIAGERPLDFKSDVWSLGRIFAQILSADLEICDPRPVLKEDDFPKDITVLIRSMLADNPELRPDSMQEVADALKRLQEEALEEEAVASPETAKEVRRLRKTVTAFGIFISLIAAIGGIFLFWYDRGQDDTESTLGQYANRYAGSVAFVMVQYQIQVEDTVLYRQRREGTAFLVDSAGYLLTNRHVACPWLEDETLFNLIRQIREANKTPRFDYQIHLWFEGDTAFNRLVGIAGNNEVEDIYDLKSAFSRSGNLRVKISGVARTPSRTGQRIRAPLRNDFAVLKINRVPQGLLPLPLAQAFDTTKLKRLSPVIALGFPLGSTTQADVINVSVTRGHIRRTFENFFQVDTSIYKGNSGGPIIDSRGKVIGIASAVATDVAVAPMPVITPLSDIGLVLPVTEAVKFIDELKAGRPKWNGILDLSAATKIKEITETALAGRWVEAQQKADQSLEDSDAPALIMTAAMMHYCNGDMAGANDLLERMLSIDAENYQARLILALIGKASSRAGGNVHLNHLLKLDWRSPGEFYGHLARILSAAEVSETVLDSWNGSAEKSWIYYVSGLIHLANGNTARSHVLFMTAARAAARDDWPLYLALAELSREPDRDQEELSGFRRTLDDLASDRAERASRVMPLITKLEGAHSDPAAQRDILLQVYELQPENKTLMALAAFYSAMASEWSQALTEADIYLQQQGREEPIRLGTSLLAPGILYQMGKEKEGHARLREFCDLTDTSWYRQICETLLNKRSEEDLTEKAGTIPEKIVTAYTALGFRAEAEGNVDLAIKHYREALGSYLDTWIEYNLARQRYIKLRLEEKK
jgi:S1-C subfamily serine protease